MTSSYKTLHTFDYHNIAFHFSLAHNKSIDNNKRLFRAERNLTISHVREYGNETVYRKFADEKTVFFCFLLLHGWATIPLFKRYRSMAVLWSHRSLYTIEWYSEPTYEQIYERHFFGLSLNTREYSNTVATKVICKINL